MFPHCDSPKLPYIKKALQVKTKLVKHSSSLLSHTPYASLPVSVPSILQYPATSLKTVITLFKGPMHKMLLVTPAVHVLPCLQKSLENTQIPRKANFFPCSHPAQAIAMILLPCH